MNKLFLLFVFCINTVLFNASADSPLTSTDFALAYSKEKMVKKAQSAAGTLTPELMKYLEGKGPIDVKMAVINTLGWSYDGKNNAELFMKYVSDKNSYDNQEQFIAEASGDILLCMAYLKALDDYFLVDEAYKWSQAALAKNTKSYTFNIINGLIRGQFYFDTDWCEVYKSTDNVRKSSSLKSDMKEEAKTSIFQYMDLYASACDEMTVPEEE